MGCHFKVHHVDPTLYLNIVENKGKMWYNKLRKIADEKHCSFTTIEWYRKNIDGLRYKIYE